MNKVNLEPVYLPTGLALVVGPRGSGKTTIVGRTKFVKENDLPFDNQFDFVQKSAESYISSCRSWIRQMEGIVQTKVVVVNSNKELKNVILDLLVKTKKSLITYSDTKPAAHFCHRVDLVLSEIEDHIINLTQNSSFRRPTVPDQISVFLSILNLVDSQIGNTEEIGNLKDLTDVISDRQIRINSHLFSEQMSSVTKGFHILCYVLPTAHGVEWVVTNGDDSFTTSSIALTTLILGCLGVATVSSASPTYFAARDLPSNTAKGGLSLGYLDYISSINLAATNLKCHCVLEIRDDFDDTDEKLAAASRVYVKLTSMEVISDRFRDGHLVIDDTTGTLTQLGWLREDNLYRTKFLQPLKNNLQKLKAASTDTLNSATIDFEFLGGQNV